MGRCITGYFDVLSLDNIVSSESFTRFELPALLTACFVDEHIWKNTFWGSRIYAVDVGSPVADDIQVCYIDGFFYRDSSLIEVYAYARFVIHQTEKGGSGFKISRPAGIYTAELTALFLTLRHYYKIGMVVKKPLAMLLFCLTCHCFLGFFPCMWKESYV
jgi:hypothetical protein